MSFQVPSKLTTIFEMIRGLTPGERRQLLRRLQASGLLDRDELLTDQNRLDIAPALGHQAVQSDVQDKVWVENESAVEPAAAPTVESVEEMVDELAPGEEYRSAVSGKVVMGPPSDADAEDPHAMRPVPGQAPEQPIVVIFDGGSKGNPGMGYGSYALRWPGQTEQIVQLQFGDRVTNNEAEYDTLIAALEAVLGRLHDLGADAGSAQLTVFGDSLLVINQITGQWRCKEEHLKLRRDEAQTLLANLGNWQLIHHDRSKSVEVLGH